jgi:peptidoglycan-associated lipoprotein
MRGHAAWISVLTSGLGLVTVLLTGCPKIPVLTPEPSAGGAGTLAARQGAPSGSTSSTGYAATAALSDVHFDLDRSAIRPADQPVLDANAGWLKSNGVARLLLEGYADERGSAAHNRALGERRAAAVRDALVARGIEASRISIRSYGEQRPLCTDRTDPCWARNRRVHFLVSR